MKIKFTEHVYRSACGHYVSLLISSLEWFMTTVNNLSVYEPMFFSFGMSSARTVGEKKSFPISITGTTHSNSSLEFLNIMFTSKLLLLIFCLACKPMVITWVLTVLEEAVCSNWITHQVGCTT